MTYRFAPDDDVGRLRYRRMVLVTHMMVVATVIAIWFVCTVFEAASDSLVRPLAAFLLVLTLWLFWSWHLVGRSVFDPYGMFLLAAVLFNGGQAYLEVFGLNRDGLLAGNFTPNTLARAIAITTCALAAFHLGALVSVTTTGRAGFRASGVPHSPGSHYLWSCRVIGIALLCVSVVPAFGGIRARLATANESGYFALYQRDRATGIEGIDNILAALIVPGSLFLLAGSRHQQLLRAMSLGLIGTYALLQLFVGYRGQAAMLAVSYVWLWHRCVRPLPKAPLLLAGAIALFVVFPLSTEVRNISGTDRTSLEFLQQAYLSIDNPIVAIFSEMGGSIIALAYTLELVPSMRPFDYGVGYLYSLTSAFPNFFWDVHPMIARGTPSDWLIWTVDPITARMGGGLGFSFIAEAYLNFGPVGVPLVMAAIGFLYCRFVLWGDRPSEPAKLAALASFTAYTLSYARGEASFLIRPLLWYALVPYLLFRFFHYSRHLTAARARRKVSWT